MLTLILSVLFLCAIVGLALWALSALPIDGTIKQWGRVVIIVIFALFAIYLLASYFGVDLPAGAR